MSDPTAILAAALEYAALGWPVLPIFEIRDAGQCACGDPRCESPGKHPVGRLVPRGLKQATTDPEVIHRWFNAAPTANLAVAAGVKAGIVVIDVDPRHGGDESLANLEAEHGTLPDTILQLTGGGGAVI